MGKKALDIVALKVELDDLYMDALFHVIDVDTSSNIVLKRPWFHTSKVIALTLHWCLKYIDQHNNEKMIQGDENPFHGEEVNYVEAKFYKSIDLQISQVPLDQMGEPERKGQASYFASLGHSSCQ